jgi:hypothetical protein
MRRAAIAALLAAVAATAWYLHDPPWLIDQRTGLRAPEQAPDGVVFRWSGGHASFFVPSDARTVRLPLATTFDAHGTAPMIVTVFVDGVRAARVLLSDERWRMVAVDLPPRGWRRLRRIDVRTSVVREDNHGVKVGEPQLDGR